MKIPYFEVAAFTDRLFGGNPAGVCALPRWLSNATLQNIATENNLAETAFFVATGSDYELRWFTPEMEIDLCGHATLASAFVLFSELGFRGNLVRFHSRTSGTLTVTREGEILTLDFPSRPAVSCPPPEVLVRGLGRQPLELLRARDFLAVFASDTEVRALQPDFSLLKTLEAFGVIATAPGSDCDFVSRFFVPKAGVPEDAVTGSSHCTLVPYWSRRLGRTTLFARQVSRRGGELFCRQTGDRILIGGKAVLYLRGEIELKENGQQVKT
ncbi:MAG TPA: PhzF family phenazine biosynthesis protein [Verrucomicrobiae bacterium]|nr:PhzF family phenazine biosynthesis protein [Verrucomicrobiae bacterium]